MPTTTTDISTGSPARYAEELVARLEGKVVEQDDDSTAVEVESGLVTVRVAPSLLAVEVEASDDMDLLELRDAVTAELEELDRAGELVIEWHRVA